MTFVLTRAAEADLADIWDYTVETWGIDQARRYTLQIKDTCTGLCNGDRQSRSADNIRPGYRKASVGRHMLYFTVTKDQVIIVRILHQSMDIDAQFE